MTCLSECGTKEEFERSVKLYKTVFVQDPEGIVVNLHDYAKEHGTCHVEGRTWEAKVISQWPDLIVE